MVGFGHSLSITVYSRFGTAVTALICGAYEGRGTHNKITDRWSHIAVIVIFAIFDNIFIVFVENNMEMLF